MHVVKIENRCFDPITDATNITVRAAVGIIIIISTVLCICIFQ